MRIVDELKKRSENNGRWLNPSWELYKTKENGYAVRDINAAEWRAVRLDIFKKDEAIQFLNKNNIRFHE